MDSLNYTVCDILHSCASATVYFFVIGDGENAGPTSCNARVGYPVNVTNGNMYLQQSDFSLPGSGSAINITRTYNSMIQTVGLFGRGWSTNYDESIWVYDNYLLRLNMPDGRAVYFARTNTSGPFTSETPGFYGQVIKNANNSFTVIFKDGRVHQFNAAGRVVSLSDLNNNQTVLGYDANARLTTITDPFGRVLTITPDSLGRVLAISDTLGNIATYSYGASNELLTVTYPDNSKYQFVYATINGKLLLTTVKDALNNILEAHQYDSQGRAFTSERHGGVELYTLSFFSATQTDVTDALGHVTKYFFDKSKGRNVVTKVEGVCSCGNAQTQLWTYDEQLNVTAMTNALNQTTTYTYDANGNRLTSTDTLGTTSYTYNGFGQVLTRADTMGGVITNTFDAKGNLLTSKDPLNNTTTLTYDARGRILTATDARGKATTFTYTSGNLTRRTDPLNNQTNYAYDARGRLTSMTDALNQTTSYGYDSAGRVNRVTYPGSSFVTFAYDLAGRRASFTDARNYTTIYAYDNAYRLTSETSAASQTTGYGYNLMSRLTSRTDALGRVTNFEYDDFNRLKKTIYPTATVGTARLEERIEYDANGNIKKRIDAAGRETLFDYDTSNRLIRATDPALQMTQLEYNARSQMTAVTDALNQRYTFDYDALGRVTQTTRAGNAMSFEYDAVGNRTKRTDYNGTVSVYSYDDLNRLTNIAYKGDPNLGDNPIAPGTSYTYDGLSRLLTAVNETGTVTIGYDNRNRVRSVTDVTGQTVTYTYDANSNRTGMSLGQTLGATYSYDSINRLTQLTDNAGASFGFGYDATNKLTSRSLPNNITSTFEYDRLDRLTRLKHVGSASTLADYQYQFNTASQITQFSEPTTTRNYGYDTIDRFTSATQTGQPSESYVYDSVGNRTASHRSASYGYQPFNKLVTTTTAAYAFDNNGNMLRKTDSAGTWQYYWNAENQLVRVVKPGAGPLPYRTINYRYDALGRRVQRQMKRGGTTDFTYDGQDVILDQKSDGSTTTYINGPGIDNKLKQTSSVTGTHYYLQDHLGSTTALTNSSGNVSSQITYDGYGNSTSNSLTRYGFTGRELDADTGLLYYRARWYDPQLGRFISEDPIGFAGGDVNLFGYVKNNPLNRRDPLGLMTRGQCFLRGAVIGGVGFGILGGFIGGGIGAVGFVAGPLGAITLPLFSLAGASYGAGAGILLGGAIGMLTCDADDAPSCDTPRATSMPTPQSTPLVPPPPAPPPKGRGPVCLRALIDCFVWAAGDPLKQDLCMRSHTECVKTNLPVMFPDGRWVPPLP